MNKILISSVAAAVLATVSGAALASSAVYVNKADISVPDTDVANQTVSSIYPYGISSYNGFEASITNPTIAVTVTSSGNDPDDGASARHTACSTFPESRMTMQKLLGLS